MQRKDVIISIQGNNFNDWEDDEPERVELVTNGFLSAEGDGFVLSYQEDAEDGEGPTLTTLLLQGPRITLLRSGVVSTQMIFEQGRRFLSFYNTDEGPLTMGVQASHLTAKMDELGGDIELEYNIEVDSAMTAKNHVKINVRATGESFSPRHNRGVYHAPYVN